MRRFVCWRLPLVLAFVLMCSCVASSQEEGGDQQAGQTETAEPSLLTIGSQAPELDIEHWVQDGNGKFKPIRSFEPGKVYVVEFWATWCGPCIASMPHLAETQQKYEEDVQIISISDEDLDTVEKFLDRPVRGEEEKTYRELTSAYCLTTDPDQSNHKAYMRAARQNGIPTAFIVGKDGMIEWIGHPMRMDEPLEQIVNDKWNREEFAKEFTASQKMQAKMADVSRAMSSGDTKEALAILDELLADAPPSVAGQLNRFKLAIMMQSDPDSAVPLLKSISESSEDGSTLNELAWLIYQYASAGQQVSEEVLAAAVEVAEKAVRTSEGQSQGYALDTLAHLKHQQGDLDAAIKYQTQAVEKAPEEQLKDYLEELKKEKESPKDEEDASDDDADEDEDDDDAEDADTDDAEENR